MKAYTLCIKGKAEYKTNTISPGLVGLHLVTYKARQNSYKISAYLSIKINNIHSYSTIILILF
jgi:hypothetical protein